MTEPSWLPQTWPADAPDIEGHYERMAPRQWQKGVYSEDSKAVLDQQVIGHVFSWCRKLFWWFRERYFPQKDTTDAYLIEDWERDFGLGSGGTLSQRANRILAGWRNRGTSTVSRIKAIFAPVFDTEDESDISLAWVKPSDTWAGGMATWQTRMCDDVTINFNACNISLYAASGLEEIMCVGDAGEAWRYNAASGWTQTSTGTAQNLNDCWGFATNYVWAVGDTGVISLWNGAAWAAGPGGGPAVNLHGVHGLDPTHVAVCGASGAISYYDGSSWTNWTVGGGGDTWRDVHIIPEGWIWACAGSGKVAKVEIATGTATTYTPTGNALRGIRAMTNDELGYVWVVGASGTIYYTDDSGATWYDESVAAANDFRTLDGWHSERLVAMGTDTQYAICWRRASDDVWKSLKTGSWGTIKGVCCDLRSCYCVAVGPSGWMLRSPCNDEPYAANQNALHIYSTGESLAPDLSIGLDKVTLCQAVQQRWSVGQKKTIRASDTACGAGRAGAG